MSNGKKISEGNSIPHTPGSAITAGDVVVQGDLVAIAEVDIAANELGALSVRGIYKLPKNTAQAFSVGDLLFWDDSADELTTTSTSNKLAGKCTQAQLAADTTALVLLAP